MKSMTIEITDSTNIAQAYGILPITWAIGSTLGFVPFHLPHHPLFSTKSKITDRGVPSQPCAKIPGYLWWFLIFQEIPILLALFGLGDCHRTLIYHRLFVYEGGVSIGLNQGG